MQFVKAKLRQLWLSDQVRRVFHAFWQAAIAALLTGLFAAHSTADVKATLFVSLNTGLAAVKALYLSKK